MPDTVMNLAMTDTTALTPDQLELLKALGERRNSFDPVREIGALIEKSDPHFVDEQGVSPAGALMQLGAYSDNVNLIALFEDEQALLGMLMRRGANPMQLDNPVLRIIKNHATRSDYTHSTLLDLEHEGIAVRGEDGSNFYHYMLEHRPERIEIMLDKLRRPDSIDCPPKVTDPVAMGWMVEAREDGRTPLHLLWQALRDKESPEGGVQIGWDKKNDPSIVAWRVTQQMMEWGADPCQMDHSGVSVCDLVNECLENKQVAVDDAQMDTIEELLTLHLHLTLERQTAPARGARLGTRL